MSTTPQQHSLAYAPVPGRNNKIFGRNVRKYRLRARLTQTALAERMTLTTAAYISTLENGHDNPTIAQASRIAAALGMPLYDLLDPGVLLEPLS